MILDCEACHARYLVSSAAIGADGRRVRCTNCGHEWYQEPEEPDFSSDFQHEDVEPIPEAVRPIPEGSALPALMEDTPAQKMDLSGWSAAAGYAAAAVVFFVVLAGLVYLRATVVQVWPPAAGMYEWAHMAPDVAGQGLTLDRMEATAAANEQGVSVLNVKGVIVNLKSHPVSVPPLAVSLRREDGNLFDSWQVRPDADHIDAGGEMEFKTSYPSVPNDAKEVKIDLLLVH